MSVSRWWHDLKEFKKGHVSVSGNNCCRSNMGVGCRNASISSISTSDVGLIFFSNFQSFVTLLLKVQVRFQPVDVIKVDLDAFLPRCNNLKSRLQDSEEEHSLSQIETIVRGEIIKSLPLENRDVLAGSEGLQKIFKRAWGT